MNVDDCAWRPLGLCRFGGFRFEDSAREPGNLGFDPLKFGENKETRARLEMAELKNGRLAMLAFSGDQPTAPSFPPSLAVLRRHDNLFSFGSDVAGMIHQTFVTGKPVYASLVDIFS